MSLSLTPVLVQSDLQRTVEELNTVLQSGGYLSLALTLPSGGGGFFGALLVVDNGYPIYPYEYGIVAITPDPVATAAAVEAKVNGEGWTLLDIKQLPGTPDYPLGAVLLGRSTANRR